MIDDVPDLELPTGLDAQPTGDATEWTVANENRPTIAETLDVPIATFAFREKSAKVCAIEAQRLKRAVEALKVLPAKGEYVHIVTGQEFTGFDLLPAMLQLAKAKAFDSLHLTTLGFSRNNLTSLEEFIRMRQMIPAKLWILCSDFFRRSDTKIWEHGRAQAERLGYGFRSTRNHTKIILARIARRSYVVESSANLRSCSNLEQFVFTQSPRLHEFHRKWIMQVWETAEK